MSSRAPSSPQERTIEDRIVRLAAPPPGVVALLSSDPRTEAFDAQVLGLVERQPGLAARILAIASRQGASGAEPVVGLPQAVARVGAGRIARLIVLNVLRRLLPPATQAVRRVWQHMLLAASAAREIARASGRATHSHEAFVAALLHDLGCFVLADAAIAESPGPEEEGWDPPLRQMEVERRLHGLDHAEVGERICRAWSLPDELVQVVRLHHAAPPLPFELDGRSLDLLRIVQQGDRLASLLHARPRLGEVPIPERLALLERTCIHPAWDWTPAGPTHLDLLVDPVLRRHAEQMAALAIEGIAPAPRPIAGDAQGDQST